jgi:hypothetical protein
MEDRDTFAIFNLTDRMLVHFSPTQTNGSKGSCISWV